MSLEEVERRIAAWRLVRGDAEALRALTQPATSKGFAAGALNLMGITFAQLRISVQVCALFKGTMSISIKTQRSIS
jgi:hypothetical protein